MLKKLTPKNSKKVKIKTKIKTKIDDKVETKVDINKTITSDLKANIEQVKVIMGQSDDLKVRQFTIGKEERDCAVLFINGLVDGNTINQNILKPLMLNLQKEELPKTNILQFVDKNVLTVDDTQINSQGAWDDLMLPLLDGDTILLVDGFQEFMSIDTKGFKERGIDEPVTEPTTRGPREGFTESIATNMSLIRRKSRDPNLIIRTTRIGRRSKALLAMCYVQGVVSPRLVDEVKKRLETIDIDLIPETGYIEQFIEDSWLSPFPQVQTTERPDKTMAALAEGRVAILLDGTPFALLVPGTLNFFFQSPEDYYERFWTGTFVRSLRLTATFIATFAPGIYIALVSFHPDLIPTDLALSIAAARQGVPFPVIVEALLMELAFELFREAGARLPRTIGQTVGIVGGIIVGDAAVSAKLASPIMVIVVALTAIASFTAPSYNVANGFRLLRFPIMIAAGTLGLFGIIITFIIVNIHMVTLKSFGTVYLAPFTGYSLKDLKDSLIRAPLRTLTDRPDALDTEDDDKQNQLKDSGW